MYIENIRIKYIEKGQRKLIFIIIMFYLLYKVSFKLIKFFCKHKALFNLQTFNSNMTCKLC